MYGFSYSSFCGVAGLGVSSTGGVTGLGVSSTGGVAGFGVSSTGYINFSVYSLSFECEDLGFDSGSTIFYSEGSLRLEGG